MQQQMRVLEFARYNDLKLVNTFGHHKAPRRWTWHSPNGAKNNQIDYIMVNRHFQTSVNTAKTQSFPGADIGSDHDLALLSGSVALCYNESSIDPIVVYYNYQNSSFKYISSQPQTDAQSLVTSFPKAARVARRTPASHNSHFALAGGPQTAASRMAEGFSQEMQKQGIKTKHYLDTVHLNRSVVAAISCLESPH